jgi:pyruvate kinase
VIVGVANATADLRQGEIVTLELQEGVVHRGARGEDAGTRTSAG